jgi:CelD/BcsL family acetyltransferase involved in cellulose biosynthesis
MDIIRSIQPFEALRDDWNVLADGGGHGLLRHEWFASWAATNDPNALRVVVFRSGGQVAAIAPLMAVRVNGIERLEFIGGSSLYEPSNLLYANEDAVRELAAYLVSLGQPMVLHRIPADSPTADAMKRAGAGRTVMRAAASAPTLAVPTRGGWTEFLGHLPSKLRYDIKRANTRAEAVGKVAIETVSPRAGEVQPLFDRLVAVESSGWKQRNGSALASKPALYRFFLEYAKRTAASGSLRMTFLRIGEELAAAQLAVQVLDRFWVLKIGYDERFARCSPGFLITCDTLRLAFDTGLAGYEFLGSPAAWEERWRPQSRAYTAIASYPISAAGAIGACADFAGATWRHLRNRLHEGVARERSQSVSLRSC